MDLLKTLLVYMSLAFATSVQTAPEPPPTPEEVATPTPYVLISPAPTQQATPVPTIAITPNPAYKTLQVGDRGDLVRTMQEKLIEYGYLAGEADGAYGNQTRRAVEQFQYQHGLSVDGIAGRHTLTVLYESEEIRLPPNVTPTPQPTPTSQISLAITPTPQPTFAPVETVPSVLIPVAAPEGTTEPAPVQEPAEKMEGYAIQVEGADEALALPPYRRGDVVYVPLMDIVRSAGLNVIASSTETAEEFAFAWGEDLLRVTCAKDASGQLTNLEAYCNTEPQLLPGRDVFQVDGAIYVPISCVESLLDAAVHTDETASLIHVTLAADVDG